jgi:UDPglucose 6-dehydrogenase
LDEQAHLSVYDPKVDPAEILHETGAGPKRHVQVAKDAYEACRDAHAIVVVTEWDEFKTLDFAKIYSEMKKPAFVFDGRNILDLAKLRTLGFQTSAIGRT